MIKRIFSNKSGFTLVEIVVAFAVFAIMAGAIMQILNLVAYEKSENAKFMASLEEQEAKLYGDGKSGYKTKDGEVVFDFGEEKGDKKIGYDMKAANGDEEGIGGGLVYFVSENSLEGNNGGSPSSGGDSGESGGSQGTLSTLNARITGSPGFENITITKVVKISEDDEDFKNDLGHPKGVCYFFEVSADGSKMTDQQKKYASFKLNFFYPETTRVDGKPDPFTDTTKGDKTYAKLVPTEANILDAGYLNSSIFKWNKDTCKSVYDSKNRFSGSNYNKFQVAVTAPNTIRVSNPYSTSGTVEEFLDTKKTKFYVIFDRDPELTINSFGHGVTDGVYKTIPVYKEDYDITTGKSNYTQDGAKISNYIYGAYMYDRVYD